MAMISRNPFAREELHKETAVGFCEFCGHTNRYGKAWQYWIEQDRVQYRRDYIPGLFCSIACMKSYHGRE